jgi:hypothetical protein
VDIYFRNRHCLGRPHRLFGGEEPGSSSAAYARGPDGGKENRTKNCQLWHIAVISDGDGDRRPRPCFGWSHAPPVVSLVGDVLVAIGVGISFLVIIQNSYAAANITVEADQKGLVRHPMYGGF